MLFNPTNKTITRHFKLLLYYTGLTNNALIRIKGGLPKTYPISRDYSADLNFIIPPNGYTWLTIE